MKHLVNGLKRALLVAFVALPFSVTADNHNAKSPSYQTVEVTENIWMLQGKGGNIGVFTGDQGTVLIDDDYQDMSDALKTALKTFGGVDSLNYIINTHWHADHTQGNLALGGKAPIVAHNNVRTRLLSSQEIKLFKMVSEPYPVEAVPSITYSQKMTLHINGETIEIVHFPNGHTDGDSVIFFRNANVVHMGDHFFSGFFPFVDIGSGGNVGQMATNVASVLSMITEDTKIIPGHGPLSKKSDLEAFHGMLVGTSKEVNDMKKQGLSLEAILAEGLSEQWKPWAKGFLPEKVWINLVYHSL